jgi:hypothetical protein
MMCSPISDNDLFSSSAKTSTLAFFSDEMWILMDSVFLSLISQFQKKDRILAVNEGHMKRADYYRRRLGGLF